MRMDIVGSEDELLLKHRFEALQGAPNEMMLWIDFKVLFDQMFIRKVNKVWGDFMQLKMEQYKHQEKCKK